MVVPEVQGERDSSDEGEQEEPAKAQARLRAAAQKEAVLLPRQICVCGVSSSCKRDGDSIGVGSGL